MIKKLLLAFVALGVVAAAVSPWRPAAMSDLRTAVVERGEFVDYLQARGEIRPARSVVLSAPSAGGGDLQIIQLVANGATVKAGDAVAVFDSTNQERTLEQRESELKQAFSELEKLRAEEQRRANAAAAELEQARSIAARQRLDLGAAELLSKVDAEKRALTLANAERFVVEMEEKLAGEREAAAADVAMATQKVEKARYDVEDTRRIINTLTLRAPTAGMVSLLPNFRAGGPLSRSAPEFRRGDRAWFGAPIAELPDLTSVQMTLRVDEADRAKLQPGRAARVRVDAVPDRELPGRVHEISLVAKPDFTSFPPVRNFDVTVALTEADRRLRSGMSATARLEIDRLPEALLVPAAAVFERNGGSIVFVVSGRSVMRRPVTIERRGREQIAIAGGLEPGERVALDAPDEPGGEQ
jgi:RND family efflux transporter MFP subunit